MLPPGCCAPFGQADGTAVCRSCPVCLCFLCHYSSWDEISTSAKSSQASVWLTGMPSPPQRSVRTVATPQQRGLERAREPMVWLILNLSCCRNHLFCLRQCCCFGSVDKLQLEEVPAWLRQHSHFLQSDQKVTSELHVSIDLEEGLLNDDQNLNPTKK